MISPSHKNITIKSRNVIDSSLYIQENKEWKTRENHGLWMTKEGRLRTDDKDVKSTYKYMVVGLEKIIITPNKFWENTFISIKREKMIIPILLTYVDINYIPFTNKDNNICECCKMLGYTDVPAIVEFKL